jgi:hypothetical protein
LNDISTQLSDSDCIYQILGTYVKNKKNELETKKVYLEKAEKEIDEKYKVIDNHQVHITI